MLVSVIQPVKGQIQKDVISATTETLLGGTAFFEIIVEESGSEDSGQNSLEMTNLDTSDEGLKDFECAIALLEHLRLHQPMRTHSRTQDEKTNTEKVTEWKHQPG